MAKEGTKEDEDKWEGDPGQVLQRKAGLHLGIGPLVGCMNTESGSVRIEDRLTMRSSHCHPHIHTTT